MQNSFYYCERNSLHFLAEPLNFFTNLLFLAFSILLIKNKKISNKSLPIILFGIGVGSMLFHSIPNNITAFIDVFFIILFIFFFLIQLYFKLKSFDVLTLSSWKIIEKNPNDIPSSIFPFKNFLDSIGIVTIKQPFGKRIDFEKLYITFLVEFTENNHELKKIIKGFSRFSEIDYSEPKYKDCLLYTSDAADD